MVEPRKALDSGDYLRLEIIEILEIRSLRFQVEAEDPKSRAIFQMTKIFSEYEATHHHKELLDILFWKL